MTGARRGGPGHGSGRSETRLRVGGRRYGAGVNGATSPSPRDWPDVIGPVLVGLRPLLPWMVLLLVVVLVVRSPLPGRGPGLLRRRDPWRRFKHDARRFVLTRAGHRCEAAALLIWGRCRETAVEVDHIYPWSKGGPTVTSNGQALCSRHNRRKADRTPAWWYVWALERRRRRLCPPGMPIRVVARMTPADESLRRRGAVDDGR